MNQTNLTIVGTGLAVTTIIVSTIALVAGGTNDHLATITGQMDIMTGQIETLRSEMNGRIDGLRSDMREDHRQMREDHREFNTRLRNVEIEFGKVEQRLETLERAVLPQAPAAP